MAIRAETSNGSKSIASVAAGPDSDLESRHFQELGASGISEEAIAARGYRSVVKKEELLELGFKSYQSDVPGLLLPIHSATGEIVSYQYKPDRPRLAKGKKPIKYDSLSGQESRIDVPPAVRSLVQDPRIPLFVTEGIKRADSAACCGACCIALPGVWNWKKRNSAGGSVTIGDLENIPLRGRDVYVVFDSDASEKAGVQAAEARLAGFLESKGANVEILRIPSGAHFEKQGLDDYLVNGGTVPDLLQFKAPREPQKSPDTVAVIAKLAEGAGVEVWMSTDGVACASFTQNSALSPVRIDSQYFLDFLNGLYFDKFERSADSCKHGLISHFRMLANRSRCEPRIVARRIGFTQDAAAINYDLGAGRVVEISSRGWNLIANPQVCFLRAVDSLDQAEPSTRSNLELLRRHINVDGENWILLRAALVGCFLPTGTIPAVIVSGAQGTGKTTLCNRIRDLVDPVRAPLRNLPTDHRDWMATLESGHMLAFDNVSHLSHSIQDTLCMVTSGSPLAGRALYSKEQEHVRTRRPVLINSIETLVSRGDFGRRVLAIELQPILSGTVSDRLLLRNWESDKPLILGGLFDSVARAIKDQDRIASFGSLADFEQFALASFPVEDRANAEVCLKRNLSGTQAALLDSPFGCALLDWIEGNLGRRIRTSELFAALQVMRMRDTQPREWPHSAKSLHQQLRRIAPALLGRGFTTVIKQGQDDKMRHGTVISFSATVP